MRCCCRCAVILWQITTLREVFHVAAEFLVVGAAEFMLIGMAALEVVHPMAEFLVVSRSFQPRSRSTRLKLAKVVCKLPLFFALRFQILQSPWRSTKSFSSSAIAPKLSSTFHSVFLGMARQLRQCVSVGACAFLALAFRKFEDSGTPAVQFARGACPS